MMWPNGRFSHIKFESLWVVLLVLIPVIVSDGTSTSSSYLTTIDKARLKQVFASAWNLKDLASVHYAVLGYQLLAEKIDNQAAVCKFLVDSSVNSPTPESNYYVATARKALDNCVGVAIPDVVKLAQQVLEKDTSSVSDIYYAIHTLTALNQPIKQHAKVIKTLQAALKKDDSISNLGYCLHIASQMGAEGAFAFDRIEDAVVQADEIDGKYLQFEGGLSITALLVSGAYNLATAVNNTPAISGDQAVKFANYFMSRRSVQTVKGAYSLLNVLKILTKNKWHVPVVLSVVGGGGVSSEQPKLVVRVSDLLGANLPSLTLTVESATRLSDSVVIISKKKFERSSQDPQLYSVSLLENKPEAGVYRVTVSALGSDSRLVGNVAVPLSVRVMATAIPGNVQIGTGDADQTTQPKFLSVTYPGKVSEALEVDTLQKLVLKFSLKDKSTGKPVAVHQAFVRFVHTVTDQEVIFVTERDSSNNYRLDLDIGAKSSEWGHLSGVYRMELIVGDVILANSFSWHLANITLRLRHDATQPPPPVHSMYRPKPEINHRFREPEKRPPVFVSNLFTGLIFLPLLVLFILWFKLGINISNFPISLSAIGFHLGLGGIFGLFAMFWLRLNMFETLKYLLGLGVVTFLCGNKMLAKIAAQRKH